MLMPLSEAIIAVRAPFAALFTQPVWRHVQVLWLGAMLCRGPRTVASVLRVMGLGGERRFEKYHRVLSRARWSGLQGARILLGLLILLLPPWIPVEIVVDETIERRKGARIKAKGRYRDAVRSTKGTVVKCCHFSKSPSANRQSRCQRSFLESTPRFSGAGARVWRARYKVAW